MARKSTKPAQAPKVAKARNSEESIFDEIDEIDVLDTRDIGFIPREGRGLLGEGSSRSFCGVED